VWASPSEAAASWAEESAFEPSMPAADVERKRDEWHRAVERARSWADDGG